MSDGKRFTLLMIFLFALMGASAVKNAHAGPVINFSVGTSVSNSVKDTQSNAWGISEEIQYPIGLFEFGYLNEGHKNGDKRDGIYADYEWRSQFSPRISTAFEIGPYFTATTVTQPDQIHYYDAYHWSILPRAKVTYQINEHDSITASWSHVIFARDNKDSDVFMLSFGFRY